MELNFHFHFNDNDPSENNTQQIVDSFLRNIFRTNNNVHEPNNFLNFEEMLHTTFIGPLEEIINNNINIDIEPEIVKKIVNEEQFKQLVKGYSTKDCSICLEINNDCIYLPCGHSFHESCIKPWLTTKSSACPNCKYDCTQISKED